jgi:hypothetical protein
LIDGVFRPRITSVNLHKDPGKHLSHMATLRTLFSFHLPRVDFTVLTYPELGPLVSSGEIELERYSRANAILKSLGCVLAPTKWFAMFEVAKNQAFQDIEVSSESIPTWIKPVPAY